MSNVNDRQVGGKHYKAEIQHWDFIELNGIGYLEAAASKYITRSRKKYANPVEDLTKALHYTEKLLDLHRAGRRHNRAVYAAFPTVEDFAAANGLTNKEKVVVNALVHWDDELDIKFAIRLIEDMIQEAINWGDDSEEGRR